MLYRLVQSGNSVIVIEHNIDVIKCAHLIFYLGPEGGEDAGFIAAEGTTKMLTGTIMNCTGSFLIEKLGFVSGMINN